MSNEVILERESPTVIDVLAQDCHLGGPCLMHHIASMLILLYVGSSPLAELVKSDMSAY